MSFRPLHDRVLVRRVEAEEKTAGGIIIPDSAKEKPAEGVIVSVGTGTRSEAGVVTPLEVKAGDRAGGGVVDAAVALVGARAAGAGDAGLKQSGRIFCVWVPLTALGSRPISNVLALSHRECQSPFST